MLRIKYSSCTVPFIIIKEQYLTYMRESEGTFYILEAFPNVNTSTFVALLQVLWTLLLKCEHFLLRTAGNYSHV